MLTGRLAIVTGGGSGIGQAVCRVLSREGAKVAVVDINGQAAKLTADSLEGPHHSFDADVSSATSVTNLFSAVKDRFSQAPCISVNCAGITRDNFLLKMAEKEFDDVIKVNLKGTYLVGQAAARNMVEASVPHASIINISSIVGKMGNMGQANYSASKAGVVGLTKTMAKELAQFNIRVNAVLPGFIDTPMVESVPDKVIQTMVRLIPAGRMGKPEEIAEVCLFLASERSSYITGTAIEVTGGLNM